MGSRDPEMNIDNPTSQTTTLSSVPDDRRWIWWLLVSTPQTKTSSSNDRRWISWLIPMFAFANVAAFIAVMYINNCPSNSPLDNCFPKFFGRFSFQPLRQNPLLGPSAYTLFKMGALEWHMVVYRHQSWRLIACIWLHSGIIHLILNVEALLYLGIPLERRFGFLRIGVLYLVSGVGGSILSSHFLATAMSDGCSGAVLGLLGAKLSELLANWTIYNHTKVSELLVLLFTSVTSLLLGIIVPHTDNFAHIGGFTTGFLLGFVLLQRPHFGWQERHQLPQHLRVKTRFLPYQLVLFITALALLIAGFTVGTIMLFKGKVGIDHCNWCRFLT